MNHGTVLITTYKDTQRAVIVTKPQGCEKGDLMKFRITCQGTRPLLLHSVQMANPNYAYTRKLKEITSKVKKTDEDHAAMAEIEFQGSLYFDDEIGPYISDDMLLASITVGAKLDRLGKQVERGFLGFDDDRFGLLYDGPRTREGLYADKNFVDSRMAGVSGKKVLRTRPIFRTWGIQAVAEFDTEAINPEDVERSIVKAGMYAGLGDYRKLFGRYNATVEAL